MRNITVLLFLLVTSLNSIAQITASDSITQKHFVKRNIVWINPSRANEINDLALSGFVSTKHSDSLKINGINIGIEPFWLFGFPYIIAMSVNTLLVGDFQWMEERKSSHIQKMRGLKYK